MIVGAVTSSAWFLWCLFSVSGKKESEKLNQWLLCRLLNKKRDAFDKQLPHVPSIYKHENIQIAST